MNTERLQILADYLRGTSSDTFDMDTWWCGTSGCALGHACTIPEFQQAGLGLRKGWDPDGEECPTYQMPTEGKIRYGFGAAQCFFGLSWAETEYIFSPESYCYNAGDPLIPQRVARRIQRIIWNEPKPKVL